MINEIRIKTTRTLKKMRKNEKCVPNSDTYFPSMTLNVAQKLNEEVRSAHCIRVSVAITQSCGKKFTQ